VRTSAYQGFIFSSDSVICTDTTEDITFLDSKMVYPTENCMNGVEMAIFKVVEQVEWFDFYDIVSTDVKS
jgi:hypothetical protein